MKKRVLMAATVPSMIGQFNIRNIHMLLEMGYEVDVAADFRDLSIWPAERIEKFRDQMKEMGVECFQVDFTRNPLKIGRHLKSYQEMVELIRKRGYAFIHTHTPIASAIVRQAAHQTGTRVIYTAHGFHFYNGAPLQNWLLFYPIEKHFSRYTDVLITINHEDYQRASEKFHARRTVRIPGVGVDTDRFTVCKVDRSAKRSELGVRDSDFLLLSVGDADGQGNELLVIEALRRMKEAGTIGNIVYLIAGENTPEDALCRRIAEYNLTDHIRLLGWRHDIDELCETVDCFMDPSARERNSIAMLEAMAAGLPLVAARDLGIRNSTEEALSGYWIDTADVEAAVHAIEKMRDDQAFRDRCASMNYQAARSFVLDESHEILAEVSEGYRHLRSILIRQRKRTELGIQKTDFVMVSVGELNENKNHQIMIRAMKDLPYVKYLIVGKGNLDHQLKELSRELGVENRVIFTGFRTDVRDLLWASDGFAFPSLREGLGIAALEGMAAGLPVIGHDVGGIRDFVIPNRTGWLCNSLQDYKEAVAACEKCHAGMVKDCSQQAQKYDLSYTDSIMREVYTDHE